MTLNLALVRCPTCRRPLSDSRVAGLRCVGCHAVYPVVGSIPVLRADPAAYLARSFVAVSMARRREMSALSEIKRVRQSEASAFRRDLMSRVASGLELNLRILEGQQRVLGAESGSLGRLLARAQVVAPRLLERIAQATGTSLPPFLVDSPSAQTGYDFNSALAYLRADWARTSDGEEQIATLRDLVSASVEKHCDRSGRAVYLGAGLGRLAFEGGRLFASVVAAELSFASAALLASIRRAPLEFCTVNWRGARSNRELVEVHRASFPPEDSYGANVDYVVADALSLPVANASLEAVVSVFFTDVVPLSKLLPEVKRVLRPGGRFISVGPLQYHFKDKAEWLTQEEVRLVVESVHGMKFEPGDRVHEMPYMDDPGSRRSIFRVWSFVATA